ncbi:endolytic transglycosylase MltG [Acidicapsa acidisoli]|uniref:endolytic transglycosylase MltG n=1 Tax=Acidicapsa acidisoli TaxID=1615681 RepID=UPI0021E02AFE|nr:endolytic transglycosylase MltG [Acidicapsa acidisoli]
MRSRRRGSRKKKGSGAGFLVFLFFFLLLLAGAAAAWFVFLPAGPQGETFVEIAPGSSSNQIATQLEQTGVVRSRYAFDLVRLWKRGRLKAGEYRFDHAAPVTEVYARIARGDVYTLPVTIPEGANRFDIAARIVQAGFLNVNKEDFLAATVSETPLIADLDPQARNLEGYLFPDTYRFPRKVTSAQIISTMVRRFRTVTSELDLARPPQTSVSRNVHDIVTLASLVERETAVASERPLVASVLANRLAKKMPLMTDPAVIYGLEVKDLWRGAIYQSDLSDPKHDTPYNTYRHIGLPPGPIANPGMASLRAAMNPAATDYLYFVAAGADPQGKSRFASTLDEHNKNVASYRKAVRQAGGR